MSKENKHEASIGDPAGIAENLKPGAEAVAEQIQRIQLENALMQQEALKLDVEAKKLERQERQYHIQDLKARLNERELSDKQKQQDRSAQGRTFSQEEATDKYRWSVCSHRKGGVVSQRDMRALTTGGSEEQYAVIKHQMINGDIWVRCLRCSKTWNPPVESNFYFDAKGRQVAPADGVFSREKFIAVQVEYQRAVNFPTRNSMSGSVQCRFLKYNTETGRHEDAADLYRESVKDTNLR